MIIVRNWGALSMTEDKTASAYKMAFEIF